MFFRILKKDLKRKKTMNVILLLFVIFSAMFAAAAVNNLSAVTKGIDNFLDLADAPDAVIFTSGETDLEERIAALDSVSGIKTEKDFMVMSDKFTLNGKPLDVVSSTMVYSDMAVRYFGEDNSEITSVEKGSVYCTKNLLTGMADPQKGDLLVFETDDKKYTFKFEGIIKDAVHSSNQGNNPRMMLSKEDYEELKECSIVPEFDTFYVKTSDTDAVKSTCDGTNGISFYSKDDLRDIFIYDKFTAYIMLAVCCIMLITAFVVLRFTIGFTIAEEFREIGVMKAVGVDNGSIRGLYIAKYAAIAVVGSVIGFFCSIPLSSVLLDSISKNIVFKGSNNVLLGLAGSAAVVVLILLFCYGCTRRIKKLSPIDAVRNGQTGERFGRKSIMHLGRSRLPATGFLAMNDVASSPKQFVLITAIFTLCVLMMTIMSNCASTLSSDKPIGLFSMPTQTDISVMDTIDGMDEAFGESLAYESFIEDTEKKLAENGMPAKCTVTYGMNFVTACGGKSESISYLITKNTPDENFVYDEGSAPVREDEVAMTESVLEKLGAEIGDRVTLTVSGEEKEYIITGTFSSFMNNGECGRLCESTPIIYEEVNNFMGIQVDFDEELTEEELHSYADKVKDIYGVKNVMTNAELVDYFTEMSGTLTNIKKIMMLITVIVTSMIVILMERSFISKEKTEIALMKAVGLRNRSIVGQHVMRFGIAALLAVGAASAAVLPVSRWLINFIFSMIGSVKGVDIAFNAFEIFVTCPAILIAVTIVGSFLTALYMKTIHASDAASIE